jgi:hypothetical protein
MAEDENDDVFEKKDWLFKYIVESFFRLLSVGCVVGFFVSAIEDRKADIPNFNSMVLNATYLAWAATCYCLHRLIPIFLRWARHTGIYP